MASSDGRVTRYKLLSRGYHNELEVEVEQYLSIGWELHGAPFCEREQDLTTQAIIYRERPEEDEKP